MHSCRGNTVAADAVFDVIQSSVDHLSAGEVFDRAKETLPGISFATVYNALRYLKENGMIGEVSLSGGPARFDRITTRHDHAICEACGKLVDMKLEIPGSLLKSAIDVSGFKPRSFELTLWGTCSQCV